MGSFARKQFAENTLDLGEKSNPCGVPSVLYINTVPWTGNVGGVLVGRLPGSSQPQRGCESSRARRVRKAIRCNSLEQVRRCYTTVPPSGEEWLRRATARKGRGCFAFSTQNSPQG